MTGEVLRGLETSRAGAIKAIAVRYTRRLPNVLAVIVERRVVGMVPVTMEGMLRAMIARVPVVAALRVGTWHNDPIEPIIVPSVDGRGRVGVLGRSIARVGRGQRRGWVPCRVV